MTSNPNLMIGPYLYIAFLCVSPFIILKILRDERHFIKKTLSNFHYNLPIEDDEYIVDYVKEKANELGIPNVQIFFSNALFDNALSVSDEKHNVIIIAESIKNRLTTSQIRAIIRHELYHLKYFTTNKFKVSITEGPLFPLSSVIVFMIVMLNYSLLILNVREGCFACLIVPALFLFLFIFVFYLIVLVILAITKIQSVYLTQLSELLSDAFSVLDGRQFDDLKSAISNIQPNQPPGHLANFHECFSIKKPKNPSQNEIGVIVRYVIYDKEPTIENWQDFIHKSYLNKSLSYDSDLRIKFLTDLEKMSNDHIRITCVSEREENLEKEYPAIYALGQLWNFIFEHHKIPKELTRELFSYIKSNGEKFNLTECSKNFGYSEFIILLALLKHVMFKNIIIESSA